ncbi:N-acetylmuramoyl-L-alanine amidase [Inconstantimicrobium porci]|uniref:N-acetylmuramoyl-L-alanine amidase n=1 Tax=Inconstantimicrobium porci TaxID=2652291 RepID=UPI001F30174C|nr:N-acetylmuramoyl-L-alanine amidase [Inconstantimicrobium porci]
MIKIKRFSVITLIIFFVVNIINVPMIKNVQALDDVKLVSTCRVTKEEAQNWARSKGATATFVNLANYYWKYSDSHGNINPSIAYVQAAKETGYGKFGGVIKEDYHNPCGLKTEKGGDDKDPNAHQKFNSWDEGVQAHLDHMALYAGLKGYPRKETYDPRHFSYLYGKGGDSIITMSKGWATDRNYGENLLKLYYNLLSYKTPKMWVEDINVSYSGSSKYLNIRGWSINATGIKSVQVYADNKLLGNAQIGLSRPDVKNAYSTYIGSENAGFTAKFDITKSILSSKSTIKIVSIGNDGVSTTSEKTINIEKPAPKMWVEDASVEYSGGLRYLNVKGWSINATGIKSVQVYADNKLLGNAQIGLSRPDVKNAYSTYIGSENAGFTAKFDITKSILSSKSTIKIVSIGNDGVSTTSEKTINIEKPAPKMWVEDASVEYSGGLRYLNVKGWSINATGIKSVQVYADNKLLGNAQIGLSRPDVKNAYSTYIGSENAGFTAKFDITKSILSSKSTIKIVSIGNDGVSTTSEKAINIEKPAPKMWVEDISVESSGSSRYLNVKGWAINATEVQCVKVYVGNTLLGNAQIGLSRPDIKKNYPNYYRSENAGFTAKFDVTKIKPISNTPIKVIAFGTDGTTTASTKVLPEQKMWVEDISIQESGLNKYLNIRGWAVNITGIKSVQVYADDKFIGNAQIGLSRPDIKKNYPNYYESENAGFTAKFDITSSVAPGVRTIKVVATGNDGVITSVNKYVSITKKSKLIVIDSGHGGITSNKQGYQDPGTVCGEYIEAELNMKVALELQKDLENLGYRTAMTNTPLSQFVDLMPRSELANSLNADLFISLHHNSFTNSSANGIETHYYSKSKASDKNKQISKEFATKVNNNLCKDYIDGYKYRNRYSKDSNFSVIRETKIPSVLIELGFLTNPNEAKHCASVKDQQIKANIIANTVKSQM